MKKNKKGFTLAELLIVVAIIGVLVAISIPIFSNQLEKSRDAVTVANLRVAYAEAQAEYLTCELTDSKMDDAVHSHPVKDSNGMTVIFKNGSIYQICIPNVTIKSRKRNGGADIFLDCDTYPPSVF
jgi:prepilin-type N-terminal cleavage/methylation domain-containing protein